MKSINKVLTILVLLAFLLEGLPARSAHAAGVRYVKPAASGTGDCSGWANACGLQAALTAATSGDELWVMAGTYKPTSGTNRSATFQLKSGVAVYGGFAGTEASRNLRDPAANLTILSGDLIGNDNSNVQYDEPTRADNSYHVVTGANNATLDGFTVTAGNANGPDCPGTGCGGGMYNNSSSPTLQKVTISSNTAGLYGGGMYNESSSPTLQNVTISGNQAITGGGMYNNTSSNPALTNAIISDNSAGFYGGGMYNNTSSSPTLTNATISGNSAGSVGGGMYNGASSPTLQNVTFSSNSAENYAGGIYNETSSPILTNVTFSGNSAGYGGGMYNYDTSNPALTEVTFSSNSVGFFGGGMYNENSNPTLQDVTFDSNPADYGGGGMYNDTSSPMLTDITFSGNSAPSGGGMDNYDSSLTLQGVTFSGNSASSGGGMYNDTSSPALTAVTFSGNSASSGGGIYNHSSSPTLTNITFSGNPAGSFGGGVYNSDSNPAIHNTILWGNTASTDGAQIYNDTSAPVLSDSVAQGGCPAGSTCTNIITDDPRLGTQGNYGGNTQTIPLLPGSSAIDAGNATYCTVGSDQRGLAYSGVCDIGAFESQGFSLVIRKGNNQSAQVSTAFADPLIVDVTALNVVEPVDGGKVLFMAPASGVSAELTGSPATIVGGSASVTATANGKAGTYQVTASASGATSVFFDLGNFFMAFLPLVLR